MERQEEIDYLTQTIADFIAASVDNSKKTEELQKMADLSKFKADKKRIEEWVELLAENTTFLKKMILNMQERIENIKEITMEQL